MYITRHRPRIRPEWRRIAVLFSVIALTMACGSGSDSEGAVEGFQQVSESGASYTVEDLLAIGFKESKTYSVENLPGAEAAIFGFWRPSGGDPVDYEVRFYASHEDAVSLGTEFAEEGTGDDAVLNTEDARYKEGVKDRRMIVGHGSGGGGRSGIGPKYGDFAVIDNLVVLCQGGQSSHSLENCSFLAEALTGGGSGSS